MPRDVLMPIILIFCIVGSFAINNTVFGVAVMLVLGLLAFIMEENGFPVAPAILGIVLGPLVEDNFMASMIKSDGDLLGFFSRPIAAVLGVITVAIWAWVIVGWSLRAWRGRQCGRGRRPPRPRAPVTSRELAADRRRAYSLLQPRRRPSTLLDGS